MRLLPAALVASPPAPVPAARIGVRTVPAGGLAVTGPGLLLLYLTPSPLGPIAGAPTLVSAGNGAGLGRGHVGYAGREGRGRSAWPFWAASSPPPTVASRRTRESRAGRSAGLRTWPRPVVHPIAERGGGIGPAQ
ncbi:hypothetical protein [Nonomuraea sp. CA-141351]|uniref:hypothetical protein n=1 Tax=Nonomuraea sp. CA-141351 TaxID=3239996 RepID=UPI003D950303